VCQKEGGEMFGGHLVWPSESIAMLNTWVILLRHGDVIREGKGEKWWSRDYVLRKAGGKTVVEKGFNSETNKSTDRGGLGLSRA